MKKQTAIFFYVLSAYVVLQFAWWGYHLIELTKVIDAENARTSKRILMIIGEGMVFFLILLLGLWKIRSSIKKELMLSRQQNNFILSVTHELKTPIATNRLALQTLKRPNLSEEKREELISKALQESQRLELLVENILNVTRLSSKQFPLRKEDVNLGEFLTSIGKRFQKNHPNRKIRLEIGTVESALIDPFVLESVINNLMENALKYTEDGDDITLFLAPENEQIKFGVKDQGKGINKEELPYIFKKFYRAEDEATRTQKGSGLGLYLVAEFVRLHQGKIDYRSNTPQGANFEITL